jgi:probable addiction module antidote protein
MKPIFDLSTNEMNSLVRTFNSGNIAVFKVALCDILAKRKNGYKDLAKAAGIKRESLYLFIRNANSNSRLDTIQNMVSALGFHLTLTPIGKK